MEPSIWLAIAPLTALNHCQPQHLPAYVREQKRPKPVRLLAYALLEKLLHQAGFSRQLIADIQRNEKGRPEFSAKFCQTLDFNLSHSGDWVAVILQVGAKGVGVDIETGKARHFERLLAHFGTKDEQDFFAQKPSAERFYHIWCAREAVLKANGAGLGKLSSIRHKPLQYLSTPYAPQGQLSLLSPTADFPLHLAWFAKGNAAKTHIELWQNEQWQPVKQDEIHRYSVNTTIGSADIDLPSEFV